MWQIGVLSSKLTCSLTSVEMIMVVERRTWWDEKWSKGDAGKHGRFEIHPVGHRRSIISSFLIKILRVQFMFEILSHPWDECINVYSTLHAVDCFTVFNCNSNFIPTSSFLQNSFGDLILSLSLTWARDDFAIGTGNLNLTAFLRSHYHHIASTPKKYFITVHYQLKYETTRYINSS